MKKVSFVIPCYRSANTIGVVVDEIRDTMPTLPEYDYEIILVNDCSPDNTLEVISALALSDRRITAVDLAKNFGQHAALMSGISHSTGDFVVCLDDRLRQTRSASSSRASSRTTATLPWPLMSTSSTRPSAISARSSITA